jgi:two-component system chemotaxis response regulator CheB
MSTKIRVVVADDSAFVRGLICSFLREDANFEVVGATDNGKDAFELVASLKPDVVTLDVDMPQVSGLEALQRIMHECPTPTIMVSGVSNSAAQITRQAIQAGAVDFILKYVPGTRTDPAAFRRDVLSKIRQAASVKVVRSLKTNLVHLPNGNGSPIGNTPRTNSFTLPTAKRDTHLRIQSGECNVIVIGASTGGPMALRELLQQLPAGFPAAFVVVQHIIPSFTSVLTALLTEQLSLSTCEAAHGQSLQQGTVYIAPGDKHLLLKSDLTLELQDGPTVSGHRPSIDVAMLSVVNAKPSRIMGVLLTGMGEDGVMGLSTIRAHGGMTFAQSPDTCVVDGMPRRAIESGTVQVVGSPMEIGWQLRRHIMRFRHSMKLMGIS